MSTAFYQIHPQHSLLHILRAKSELPKAVLSRRLHFSELTITTRRRSVALKDLLAIQLQIIFQLYTRAE